MARTGNFSIRAALEGLFSGRQSVTGSFQGNTRSADSDFANNVGLGWVGSDALTRIPGIKVDSDNLVQINDATRVAERMPLTFYLGTAGAVATRYIIPIPIGMTITDIAESHATAESTATTLTMQITHETGTTAAGSGTAVMTNTFNLKGTANTVQWATLLGANGDGTTNTALTCATGDALSILIAGTPHEIAGVTLTIWVSPGCKGFPIVYQNPSAGAGVVTQNIFQANRDLKVISGVGRFSVKGTDAGAVTLDFTKDTGTNAPGGGTSILSATVNLKGTINTNNTLALTATAATLAFAAGNRLSAKITGTPTAVDGLCFCVWVQSLSGAYYGQIDPTICVEANGSLLAAQAFVIFDRDYEIVDMSGIWDTAGTDAGTVTWDMGIAKGTTAPGSATAASTGAVSAKTTANTTSVLPINTSRRLKLVSRGDRAVLILNGTLTALAGVGSTISLLAR